MPKEYHRDIELEMKIKPMPIMPEKWTGHLTESEVEAMDSVPRELRPLMLGISRLDQKLTWAYAQQVTANDQAREAEADNIGHRKTYSRVMLWTITVVAGSFIAAFAMWCFKLL